MNQTSRRIDNAERVFARELSRLLEVLLVREVNAAIRDPIGYARSTKKKSDEEKIQQLIAYYGMRQIDSAARKAGIISRDQRFKDVVRAKPTKIKWFWKWLEGKGFKFDPVEGAVTDTVRDYAISQRMKDSVRLSVQNIIAEARDVSRHWNPNLNGGEGAWVEGSPSVGEIARRIKRQWHGESPGEGRIHLFSSERAAIIARTELVQAENTMIMEGYEMSGVKRIEWLAHRDGRSGSRRHGQMHGERVKVGEMFKMPSGARLRYPGDPLGPIGETIQCRCTIKPVFR